MKEVQRSMCFLLKLAVLSRGSPSKSQEGCDGRSMLRGGQGAGGH